MFKNDSLNTFAILCFSLASIYSLILSPDSPARCFFFAFTFLLIISLKNITPFLKNKIYLYFIITLFIYTNIYLGIQYNYITKIYTKILKDNHTIIEQKKDNKTDYILKPYKGGEGAYNILKYKFNFNECNNCWLNSWMAEYYGVDSIKYTKK